MILLIVDDVYKTGTLHLIHDDSHKNLENNLTLAKLCMYYCDHNNFQSLTFPKNIQFPEPLFLILPSLILVSDD